MANEFLTPDIIANEALMQLENDLVFGNLVHTDYSKEFASVGDKISIRRPQQFKGQSDNLDVSGYNEDLIDGKIQIKMNKTETIKFKMGVKDKTLSIAEYSKRYIKPAVTTLRDRIETELASLYADVAHFSGTPGVTPGTFKSLGNCGVILTNAACPTSPRNAVHDPETALELADGLKDVYVSNKAKTAFEEATIGRYARFQNYESVHPISHIVGDYGGTPLVNGAAQGDTYAGTKDTNQTSLVTDGWDASTVGLLKRGDIITIAGVFAVNPISRRSTGALKTFTVVEDVDSDGGGNATLTVSPAIIPATDAFATVDEVPADNAVIEVKTGAAGAQHKQSLLFHPDAFALVTRPLEIETGAGLKVSRKTGNKMTIMCSEWIDGATLTHNIRLDILFGTRCIDERLACRLTG